MHDDLQQTLAAIGTEAGAAALHLRRLSPSHIEAMERIEALSSDALGSTRHIIAKLRPQVLERMELPEALRTLATEFQQGRGVRAWPCDRRSPADPVAPK